MRTLELWKVVPLVVLFATGCGSDPASESDFYKGGTVEPGQPTEYPEFEAQPYPEGPYGTDIGSVIPNMRFLGWKNPTASGFDVNNLDEVSIADAYDPDGSKGIKFIYITGFAKWCPPCKAEFATIKTEGLYAAYRAKGIELMGAMMEDANLATGPGPAKPSDIRDWADTYDVEFPLVTDPNKALGIFFAADAFPGAILVDARTMRLTDKIVGGDMEAVKALWEQKLAGN
jgi:thiol-disulfide isomerase/thioredoxin